MSALENPAPEQETLGFIVAWGERQDAVRAMILTSTRAVPGAVVDSLSDYDVILILTDIHPFAAEWAWLEDFGRVLVMYRDPIYLEEGFETSGNVVQFEGDLKIDFTLMSVEHLQHIAAQPQLPDEFDAGYRILLDKDHLTDGLKPPTYKAYIPTPPTESAYLYEIEDFLLQAIYVAKLLWRDDLMAAKYILDGMMKHEHLLPMLEWHVEIVHGWSVKPSPYGRGLKRWLCRDLWAELEDTYAGADIEANWEALYRTMALMHRAAVEVGDGLGYRYPDDLERRVRDHLERIKKLTRQPS